MGKWVHRLSNIDEVSKVADCSNCGRVRIVKKNSWRCYAGTMSHARKNNYPDRPLECTVCGSNKRICFDHNHKTGYFRGWLCNSCNVALGCVNDDADLLRKLANYLERF